MATVIYRVYSLVQRLLAPATVKIVPAPLSVSKDARISPLENISYLKESSDNPCTRTCDSRSLGWLNAHVCLRPIHPPTHPAS